MKDDPTKDFVHVDTPGMKIISRGVPHAETFAELGDYCEHGRHSTDCGVCIVIPLLGDVLDTDGDEPSGIMLTKAQARALYSDVFEGIEDFRYWEHPVLSPLQSDLSRWYRRNW